MEIYGAAVAEKLDRNRGILKRRYYRQVGSPVYLIGDGDGDSDLGVLCGI